MATKRSSRGGDGARGAHQRHPVRARDVLVSVVTDRLVAVNVFVLTRVLSISPQEGATVISECVHQIE